MEKTKVATPNFFSNLYATPLNPKPVVAYITGRLATQEKHVEHAGATVIGNARTASSKIDSFT